MSSRRVGPVRLYRADDSVLLTDSIEVAAKFGDRLRGLLGRDSLPADSGLLLSGVNGVHTFGMAFPIDVVFIDAEGKVLKVIASMSPARIERAVPGGQSCLELAAGAAARYGIEAGVRLRFSA